MPYEAVGYATFRKHRNTCNEAIKNEVRIVQILKKRVAFVTGGGSGLGRAQAEKFAEAGAEVVVADLNAERAAEVADGIVAKGGSALAVQVDVTDAESIAIAVAVALDHHGRVDILSNTAGMFDQYQPVLEASAETWERVMSVNLTSLFLVTKAFLPSMIENGGGVVLNIASGAGLRGGGGGAAYTSSKHGVVGFTRQLAADYGRHGIRVNAIAPGLIQTPMVEAFSASPEAVAMVEAQPAGRIGQVSDIANAALFLVSDDSDFIHAVTLPVDGGLIETL